MTSVQTGFWQKTNSIFRGHFTQENTNNAPAVALDLHDIAGHCLEFSITDQGWMYLHRATLSNNCKQIGGQVRAKMSSRIGLGNTSLRASCYFHKQQKTCLGVVLCIGCSAFMTTIVSIRHEARHGGEIKHGLHTLQASMHTRIRQCATHTDSEVFKRRAGSAATISNLKNLTQSASIFMD